MRGVAPSVSRLLSASGLFVVGRAPDRDRAKGGRPSRDGGAGPTARTSRRDRDVRAMATDVCHGEPDTHRERGTPGERGPIGPSAGNRMSSRRRRIAAELRAPLRLVFGRPEPAEPATPSPLIHPTPKVDFVAYAEDCTL